MPIRIQWWPEARGHGPPDNALLFVNEIAHLAFEGYGAYDTALVRQRPRIALAIRVSIRVRLVDLDDENACHSALFVQGVVAHGFSFLLAYWERYWSATSSRDMKPSRSSALPTLSN